MIMRFSGCQGRRNGVESPTVPVYGYPNVTLTLYTGLGSRGVSTYCPSRCFDPGIVPASVQEELRLRGLVHAESNKKTIPSLDIHGNGLRVLTGPVETHDGVRPPQWQSPQLGHDHEYNKIKDF